LCFVVCVLLIGCAIGRQQRNFAVHRVVPGDTLSGIAASYGTSVETLVRLNRIPNPDRIEVGDRIRLPEGAWRRADTAATSRTLAKGIPVDFGSKRPKPRKILCLPVGGKPNLTSGFGPRWGRDHRGVDFAAPAGTPVLAAAKGTVVHVGKEGVGPGRSYGNYVVLHHGGGLYTLYAHLDRVMVNVDAGVKAASRIAAVGSTGRSKGPHLHFEVIDGVVEVDPMVYLPGV